MAKETQRIILGDEYDEVLREALHAVLLRNGAIDVDKSWGIGGSQEIEILIISLGSDVITIEAETFVGLSVSGPKTVVEEIALQVRRQLIS